MFNSKALKLLLETSGLSYKENSISYVFACPRCGKSQKLAIHKEKGFFCCYKCKSDGFKGRAEYALHELLGIPLSDLKNALYGTFIANTKNKLSLSLKNPLIDDFDYNELEDLEDNLLEMSWPLDFVGLESPLFKRGADYLYNVRGLREEHVKVYNIKYHPQWNTVVFPVSVDGSLYGWQERGIGRDFKYTSEGLKKERILMFQDRLVGSNHAVLTEGPVDGLKAHLCGGNVVTMGKGISDYQLNIVKSKVKRVYLGLDPDAYKEIDKYCRSLSGHVDTYLLFPPKGKKDLGECTEEEVYEQFCQAKRWSGQLFIHFKG